jgi:[1-hydroxy-2-(trimethylamino)ethyl]phosphonate dioxygenase
MSFPKRADFCSDEKFVDTLLAEIDRLGADWRYDEEVTQLEHAIQSAWLARQNGDSSVEITAALLHDIGHFLMAHAAQDERHKDRDLKHEEVGANWLNQYFLPEVAEPVRLHVPAKRYLCKTRAGYWDDLSQGSKISLEKQGGPMSQDEANAFEALPSHNSAVKLRLYDDEAKVIDRVTPSISDFAKDVINSLKAR